MRRGFGAQWLAGWCGEALAEGTGRVPPALFPVSVPVPSGGDSGESFPGPFHGNGGPGSTWPVRVRAPLPAQAQEAFKAKRKDSFAWRGC